MHDNPQDPSIRWEIEISKACIGVSMESAGQVALKYLSGAGWLDLLI